MGSYTVISKHKGIFKVYLDDEILIAHFKNDTLVGNNLTQAEIENCTLDLIVIEDIRLYSESDMKEGFVVRHLQLKNIRETEILRITS